LNIEGTNTIQFYSVDNASNVEVTDSFIIKVDTISPVTTPTITGTINELDWYKTEPIVSFAAADDTSGVDYINYSLESAAWITYTVDFTITKQGNSTVDYYSVDNAGNLEDEKSFTLKVDTIKPISDYSLEGVVGNNDWYITNINVSISATDIDGSGVDKSYHRVSGDIPWIEYITSFNMAEEGINTIEYYSIDYADNEEDFKSFDTYIDTVAPETTFSLDGLVGTGGWYISTVYIELSGSDGTSGYNNTYYRINEGDWIEYTEIFNITVEGTNTLDYYSIDNAGNLEDIESLDINIDTVAPETTYEITGTMGKMIGMYHFLLLN
jgi:hypothetical protein